MRTILFILSILLFSCGSKKHHMTESYYEGLSCSTIEIPDGFGESSGGGCITLTLYENKIPYGIHYFIENERLAYLEGYTNGFIRQKLELNENGKINKISTNINYTETTAQEININNLSNVFYVADNNCKEDSDSVKNGTLYHKDDSCRLIKLIRFENGIVTNVTNLDGHGRLTDMIFKFTDYDTILINPSDNSEMYFTKDVMKVVFHPTGFYKKSLIGYTTDEAGIENAYFPPQEVEYRSDDGFPDYDYYYEHDDVLKAILPTKLESNAKKMNDSQRSYYVLKMLAIADSSFLKIDDFVIFLNYLQDRCTKEHSESIGCYFMNIYLKNNDKISRLEEYIAMMPIVSQKKINKTLCRILLYEYAIEKMSNNTINTKMLYKDVPILEKHNTLTEEVAKESEIKLINE